VCVLYNDLAIFCSLG